LHSIFEQLRPEVIFLEVPPDNYDEFFISCSRENLESKAVRLYRENNQVELVPVDIPTPDIRFFEDYKYLQRSVESNSRDSRRLLTWHRNYIFDYGFAYLNSEHCRKMFADISADEIATIKMLADARLNEISQGWDKKNELREIEMIKNISDYSKKSPFERGVFLIGAAHRQSIIDRTSQSIDDHSNQINWDFSYFQK
jgi:hypothetical protein